MALVELGGPPPVLPGVQPTGDDTGDDTKEDTHPTTTRCYVQPVLLHPVRASGDVERAVLVQESLRGLQQQKKQEHTDKTT